MTQLSKHFTLEEFTKSDTAKRLGIPNIPPEKAMPLITAFCEQVLEPLRARWGIVIITSGYRSPIINSTVHGSPTSDHVADEYGCGADCQFPEAPSLQVVFDWLRLGDDDNGSNIPFDQIILERGKVKDSEADDCIHLGYRPQNRRMAMAGATHNASKYEVQEVV